MKTQIIFLTCALSAAACGGSDARPAQDPATGNTTTTSSMTDTSSSMSTNPASASDYASPSTPGATTGANPAAPTVGPAPMANTMPAATPASPGSPAVLNNPGVADQTKNADNTKVNDRDRHGAVTPMDQGNSSSEIKITAAIRKGIMSDKSLSFGAKNVKVITVGSKVTLRGPVKTDQERTTIETLAKQAPGVSEVDNQLEVKK